jgi:Flp pilus assembly pilin Flp
MHMRAWLERFWRDKRGMEEVEIGVVASLVVLIGALVFIQIGDDSQVSLGALEQVMDYVANQSGS